MSVLDKKQPLPCCWTNWTTWSSSKKWTELYSWGMGELSVRGPFGVGKVVNYTDLAHFLPGRAPKGEQMRVWKGGGWSEGTEILPARSSLSSVEATS